MDRCPVELLLNIFALACSDGGQTGCSLSLVSKGTRDIADRVRLNTVSLHSYDKIKAFHKFLLDRPQEHRIVRHLFITPKDSGHVHLLSEALATKLQTECRNASRTIMEVLSLVAPFIHNLTLARVTLPHALPHDFPELREMVMHTVDVPENFLSGSFVAPRLQRLAISAEGVSTLPGEHLTYDLTRIAPRLTHLALCEAVDSRSSDITPVLEDLWTFVQENQQEGGIELASGQPNALRQKGNFVYAPKLIIHDKFSRVIQCVYPFSFDEVEEPTPERNLRLRPDFLWDYSSSAFRCHWSARIRGEPGMWEEMMVTEY